MPTLCFSNASKTHHEYCQQHGGPFPADLAREECYQGLCGIFFFLQYLVLYQRGVNTSFQCCDQVLPLSQQLTITFGGWELL